MRVVRWGFNQRIIKRKKKYLANSVWATVFIPVDLVTSFTRNFWVHTFPLHFPPSHNGIVTFVIVNYKGAGYQYGQFQKSVSLLSPVLIFAQGSLRWITTGLSKVTSGGGALGMCRMCILLMLGRGGCSLLGFYPFSLVWLIQ